MNSFSDLENLIRKIEPSMAEVPIYLLNAQEVDVISRPLDVLAWTSFLLDLQARDQLTQQGRWKGEGFATVLHIDRIPDRPNDLIGTVLHEFAHWLTFPERTGILATVTSNEANDLFAIATDRADRNAAQSPPWMLHELDFIRAACHLAHRSGKLCNVLPWHLSFSWYYNVGEQVWMDTLRDELRDLEAVSIKKILTTEPPRDFRELNRILTSSWKPVSPSSEETTSQKRA